MKVLILSLTKGVYPLSVGGVEMHVYNLAKYLSTLGEDISVLSFRHNAFESEFYKPTNTIKVENIENIHFILAETLLSFHKYLKQNINKYDIVHIHAYRSVPILPSAFNILSRVPVIVTPHAIFPPANLGIKYLQKIYDKEIGIPLFNLSSKIIVLTHQNLKDFVQLGADENKLIVLPNPISLEEFKNPPSEDIFREKYKIDYEYLLFNGRLVHHKGVHVLINALKSLRSQYDIKLIVIGKGSPEYETYLQRLVKQYNLDKYVLFIPFLPREEQLSAYVGAKAFVLPSYREGLPTVLLEAMALGKIVVTRESIGHEIITPRYNGFLFSSDDYLAKVLDNILTLTKPEEVKISRNSKKTVIEKYSWEHVSKKIRSVYYSVAG